MGNLPDGGADQDQLILTPRLIVRPIAADDVESLLDLFADPVATPKFWSETFGPPQAEQWVANSLQYQEWYGFGFFAVIRRADGLLIGYLGLEVERVDSSDIWLSYVIRSDCWGHGYATEAALALRDHAFGPLGITRLVSYIPRGNDRSRRVAEKIGMQLDAEFEYYGAPDWRFVISAS